MKRMLFSRKAVYTLELTILIALVALALAGMSRYLIACCKGRYLEDTATWLGGYYRPGR